ncbi:putative quinol monooxygenase [Halosolutus gelatinilyticus]|uniref:putative quinol monooxygenase n=1 Tax=Halosolutus gelatinilyticus TaxID=2931975 RepID=UPI001FF0FDA1|nr:putative quinol monooxygenase [Halosolutus gelatinilyticus]
MIVVHTSIPFDPDRYDEAIEFVRDLADQSRREDGTVRYRATVDFEDEHTVRFFEQYEDEAAMVAHTKTDYYQRFNDPLSDLVDGPMETIALMEDDLDVYTFTADDLDRDSS